MSDIEKVKKLREATGAGFKDCNLAIKESNGDLEKAIEILRVKGISKASKKMSRDAKEGVVAISGDEKKTSIIEVNCETDFVAKNEDFGKLTESFLDVAIKNNLTLLSDVLSADIDGLSIADKVIEQTGVIGEKLEISYFEVVEGETVYGYNHPGNRIATIVALNKAVDTEYAKDCAMQIAAMNPVAIDRDDVDEAIVAKEIEIAKELLIQEGKPAEMVDKIALGKLNKFFKENTLINQAFIKDSKKSVKQYLSEGDADLTVTAFKRYSLS